MSPSRKDEMYIISGACNLCPVVEVKSCDRPNCVSANFSAKIPNAPVPLHIFEPQIFKEVIKLK